MSDVFQRYLRDHSSFEISDLIDPEIDERSRAFPGIELFKYYPEERVSFFDDPLIRFSQRTALNDPFELVRRWREFGSSELLDRFKNYVVGSAEGFLADDNNIVDLILEELRNKGVIVTENDRNALRVRIMSPEGRALIKNQMAILRSQFSSVIDMMFTDQNLMDDALDKVINETGIFSVSEIVDNHQLWGLYASSGRGFVVGWNANHELFQSTDKSVDRNNMFMKVMYSRENQDFLMDNPYSLFLGKDSGWSFEREWRMLRKLDDADLVLGDDPDKVYLYRVPKGAIRRVVFGYAFSLEKASMLAKKLSAKDDNIRFEVAVVDRNDRSIRTETLAFNF